VRILVVSNLLPPRMLGGFELAALNLSAALRERGHEVLVLTSPAERAAPEQEGWVDRCLDVRDAYFLAAPVPDPGAQRQLEFDSQVSNPDNARIVLERIRSFRPDHVLTFGMLGLGGLGILAAIRDTGVPFTMNLGDDVPGRLLAGTPQEVREVYDAVDGGLFEAARYAIVSRTLGREVERSVRLGPVRYIARGVRYPDVPRGRPRRQDGVTRFVSVGILAPHKGVDIILDAAQRLVEAGREDFAVDFYGAGDAAGFAEALQARGLGERLAHHGPVAQRAIAEAEAQADALVFPTWHREPGASTPGEAAAVGCLPILTGDCGPAEWFVDGVHALKIERDAESLAGAMLRVMDGEIDLAAFAEAGRRLASGALSFERSVARLESWLTDGSQRVGAVDIDFDAISAEIGRRDRDARVAWNRAEEESTAVPNEEPATAEAPTAARLSLWHRGWGRLLRPIVQQEIAGARDELERRIRELDAREAALREREAAADARDERVEHLLGTLRTDVLATNQRIDALEERA